MNLTVITQGIFEGQAKPLLGVLAGLVNGEVQKDGALRIPNLSKQELEGLADSFINSVKSVTKTSLYFDTESSLKIDGNEACLTLHQVCNID